jgi:ABC-2 type transport system permease protein
MIATVIADSIHQLSGATLPVNIETVALGDVSDTSWNDRLLPLVVLTALFIVWMMIPASSMINEKNKRTL